MKKIGFFKKKWHITDSYPPFHLAARKGLKAYRRHGAHVKQSNIFKIR